MHPYIIHTGSLSIATYGFLSALGYMAAAWYLYAHLKEMRMTKEIFWNLVTLIIAGAVIGENFLRCAVLEYSRRRFF